MNENAKRAGEAVVRLVGTSPREEPRRVEVPAYGRGHLEEVEFMSAMILVLLGNYSRTGHLGGPLAATTMNVACHLLGADRGGLGYDLRSPKDPLSDRFMVSGGHCVPSCYALWMVLYEALLRERAATGGEQLEFDPEVGLLSIDALGFRRGKGALETLLRDNGLEGHPLFAQGSLRGIRSLAGHSETTDVTNDVNGGPSGIGISTAAGKAMFWDVVGGPESLKVLALEGEFAMTEGHAQELKTAAVAQRVGKRLRILLSNNNAGIDDALIGGVVGRECTGYDLGQQWASYGWNVLAIEDGNDFDQVTAALSVMEAWPGDDRRPMILLAPTEKGRWPGAADGRLPGYGESLTGHESHPYALPMNGAYFRALAETYERRFEVEFAGIRDGTPTPGADHLVEFKTNIDVALSPLDGKIGLREWIVDRLQEIAAEARGRSMVAFAQGRDPFRDDRLRVEKLPAEPVRVRVNEARGGTAIEKEIRLFARPGENLGARRAVSEVGKWMNHVTGGRFFTVAADLSGSINVEGCHFFGHYDPVGNPAGTRLKAPIQEAVNTATIAGLASQSLSSDPEVHEGVWGLSGSYGAFTPLMYTPARVFSQQNQDSPFALGVLTILAAHSGPETAADARTHFGIFAPQVWTLLPRGQVINLNFYDYNDVAPGYFAAVERAARTREIGIIVVHIARPDAVVADRTAFADPDLRAARKGIYLIRDYDPDKPRMGTVFVQGASATANVLAVLPRLLEDRLNVRLAAVVSEELFGFTSAEYHTMILPPRERVNAMVVSTGTKRVPPVSNLGFLTEEYSLYADFDDRWRTGGSEEDVIAEAHLDEESVFRGIKRFAESRAERMARQFAALEYM